MQTTNGRKVIAEKYSHYTHFFVWVTLIATLIAMGGCTPTAPIIKNINIDSPLDLHRINTNFQAPIEDVVFFLGGPTRSYWIRFTVSGLSFSGNTIKVLSGGGQEHLSVNHDGHFVTPAITGNVVIFRHQVNCSGCDAIPPEVNLDSVRLTLSTTPVFPSVEAGVADTVSSMPVNLDSPIYLLIDNNDVTTYFLSVSGVANQKVFAGLDGTNKALISEPTRGFILGEDQAIDVMDNNTSLNPKLLTPTTDLSTLLFTVPLEPGEGIVKFSISRPETQLLDFGKVAAAGGGFYTPDAATRGCNIGRYDAMTGPPGEGFSRDEPGVIFGAKCTTTTRRIEGNLFAYTNFRLKNGWAVKSVGRLFATRADWFISEAEAVADSESQGNQQGSNIDIAPSAGSQTPFLNVHIWAESALPGHDRTWWLYVRVEIEGPPGTDPYGRSPCSPGLMSVPIVEGDFVCAENRMTTEQSLLDTLAYDCEVSDDCRSDSVCGVLIPDEKICVPR